jgi:uncharacterized protein YegP (UPF0339 family)
MGEHFEIVRTDGDQPWHTRFRDDNGEIVWSTENYVHRTAAVQAIEAFGRPELEVEEVDERGGGGDGEHVGD